MTALESTVGFYFKQCEFLLPYIRAEREEFRENPFITHYSNAKKPWHYGYEHPRLHEWFALLNQTAWAGCRPKQAVKQRAIEGSSNAGKSRDTAAQCPSTFSACRGLKKKQQRSLVDETAMPAE